MKVVAIIVLLFSSVMAEDPAGSSWRVNDINANEALTTIYSSKNGRKAPLKICVLSEPSPISYVSGYANRFQELLRYLHRNGDEAHLITTEVVSNHRPVQFEDTKFPVSYTRGVRMPFYKSMSISFDWTFCAWRVIHQQKPDLIHASSPGFLVLGAFWLARLYQIPLMVSYHTHIPKYVHAYKVIPHIDNHWAERVAWILLRLLRWADLILVTSEQIQQEFLEQRVVARPGHCDVWQKGIDTHTFHPRHSSEIMRDKMTNGNTKDFVMLYVGRLAKEKRLEDLRGVLSEIRARGHRDCRLCFVGTGPQHEELETEVFQNDDCVHFLGELHGLELAQAFASADVFVFPSDSETLGFVVLEAMASGLPVVAARAGGVPNLIEHGVTSFLCEPGSTSEYVDYLVQLKGDASLRTQIGSQAREETERWSWEASMSKLRHIQYLQAIENFELRWEIRLKRFVVKHWRRLVGQKDGLSLHNNQS